MIKFEMVRTYVFEMIRTTLFKNSKWSEINNVFQFKTWILDFANHNWRLKLWTTNYLSNLITDEPTMSRDFMVTCNYENNYYSNLWTMNQN